MTTLDRYFENFEDGSSANGKAKNGKFIPVVRLTARQAKPYRNAQSPHPPEAKDIPVQHPTQEPAGQDPKLLRMQAAMSNFIRSSELPLEPVHSNGNGNGKNGNGRHSHSNGNGHAAHQNGNGNGSTSQAVHHNGNGNGRPAEPRLIHPVPEENAPVHPEAEAEYPADLPKFIRYEVPRSSFLPLQFLKKDAWLIAGVALFVSGFITVYGIVKHEDNYVSNATVIIKDSAITTSYVLPGQAPGVQTTSSNAANPVLNMMGLLRSSSVKKDLWEFFATRHPQEMKRLKIDSEQKWEAFFGDGNALIKAKNTPGTDLISIQFSWTDDKIAREGLHVVLKAFQEASLNISQAEQKSRSKYLEIQVQDIQTRLRDLRKQKSSYKIRNGTVNVMRESDDLAHTRIDLENQLNQTLSRAQGKEEEVKRYQEMLGMNVREALTASAVGMNGTLSRLQDTLYTLKQNHQFLKTTLTDKHPKVQEVNNQIREIERQIQAEKDRTLGSRAKTTGLAIADGNRSQVVSQLASAQAEAKSLNAQAAVIRGRLAQLSGELAAFPKIEEGINNIEEQERSLSNALENLRQKLLEAHMKQAEMLSNVFVVDEPNLPINPKFPTRVHLIFIGAILGLVAGVAVSLVKNMMFNRNRMMLLDALGLPSLEQPAQSTRQTAEAAEANSVSALFL